MIWNILVKIWEAAAPILLGVIITRSSAFFKDFRKSKNLSKRTDLALLQYSIANACRQYAERGSVSRYALETIEGMYAVYEELGGNGVASKSMEQIRVLPIEDFKGVEKNEH